MRLLFMGTGEIGIPILESLLQSDRDALAGVVTQPDRPAGRGGALAASPVKELALAHGAPVWQPERVRDPGFLRTMEELQLDLALVVAYGQILPGRLLRIPRLGCVNVHASLLPRHRGASPIQAAIRAGDAVSGLTLIYMDEGLDTGDVLLSSSVALAPDETGGSLHDRLAQLAPAVVKEGLDLLRSGNPPRHPQDAAAATLTRKLTREDGRIDWGRPAEEIERWIRAYDPWPGTWTPVPGGKKLKLFPPVTVSGSASGSPGTLVRGLEGDWLVAAADRLVRLGDVQAEGRNRMEAAAFLRGSALPAGAVLG